MRTVSVCLQVTLNPPPVAPETSLQLVTESSQKGHVELKDSILSIP